MIRARRADDIAVLAVIADRVRALDRWPPHRVGPTIDFLIGAVPIAAFVAEDDGELVGHVLVQERSAEGVMALASDAIGTSADNLAVISRLFVDPARRGEGIGEALLQSAVGAATAAGRQAILDVWIELNRAIALYERAGWHRLGEVTFTFKRPCGPDCLHADGSLTSFVYSSPQT